MLYVMTAQVNWNIKNNELEEMLMYSSSEAQRPEFLHIFLIPQFVVYIAVSVIMQQSSFISLWST